MKAIVSFLAIFLFSISALAQRTLIVDNNNNAPEGEHIYSNLQDAILASESGDIIQLVPSNSGYEWPNNSNVWEKSNYTIKGYGLNTDLDNVVERGRSIITNQVRLGGANSGPTNVTIDGVVMQQGFLTTIADNILIKNSEVNGDLRFAQGQLTTTSGVSTNFIFRNNIILALGIDINGNVNAFVYENNIIRIGSGRDAKISFATLNHNLIIGANNNTDLVGIENIFNNNIILGFTGTTSMIRSVFNHNLMEVTLGQNDGSSGEFNIVKELDLSALLDDERVLDNSWNRQWELTSTSDDIVGRASHGGNIGPTGSNSGTPFKRISYSLPVITDLIAPTTFKVGTNPTITIKAKGN